MRSFALWYSSQNEQCEEEKEISVHINLWNKNNDKSKNYCFDFGFLIEDISNIKMLYLYVPFKVKKDNIKDLGSVISKNNKLVSAIFNENFTTTAGKTKKLVVNGNSSKPKFVIYSLETKEQIKIMEINSPGSILEINLNNISVEKDTKRFYFRIRIEACNKDIKLIDDQVKGISIFSDQFTNTEIIDFRINDIRSCSDEVRERFEKSKKFNISAIHYLILRDANDIIIYNGNEISSRILEHDLWKDYIDGINHNMIAYHLKKKAKKCFDVSENKYVLNDYVDDFSALIRFQYQKGTKVLVFIYVLGVILLGAIGGILGNFLFELIKLYLKNH